MAFSSVLKTSLDSVSAWVVFVLRPHSGNQVSEHG